jgi:lysozyme
MNRKTIFDAVRSAAPARLFNDPGNVLALDNLLDAFGVPRDTAPAAPKPGRMAVSAAGIALIHQFEGCEKKLPDGRLQAYPDPGTGGAPWTIGWGSTTDEQGRPIQPGTVWTQDRADARFRQHLAQFEAEVNQLIGDAPTTQGQFDALVSFAYNVGTDIDLDDLPEGLGDSTLLKKHKAWQYAAAADQFRLWNKAKGKVMPGLTRRRAAEAAMYRGGQ